MGALLLKYVPSELLQKYDNLHHPVSFTYWNPEVCWHTSPMGAIKMLHLSMLTCKSMSTYITQYLLLIEILKYVDLHHPWVQLKCFIWVCWLAKVWQLTPPSIFYLLKSWSMLTYITHGCYQNASFEYADLKKYVNLHHPVSYLPYLLKSWSMLTYITHGCNQNASFEYADLQKYVNLHHPVSFTYWNPEVCWLASSMCEHDPMKYADLHHPFVLQILWSMLSYITFILLWFLKSWHNRLV